MGITLFKEDLESLDKGQYMTDTMMDLFIAIFKKVFRKEIKEKNKAVAIRTKIFQLPREMKKIF